mmetsp:Transcript_17223/g.29667  ORF Transcript_17223/g.29667 Transcript_17223/m.29667 type:complete len:289 (+) Transcript_17223:69-935(+)
MTKQTHCIAGSIAAGSFSTLLGHPLDTIKVHQQTNSRLSRSSLVDITKYLAKGDVLRLFRGIGPPMANQIIMNSVMFTVFNNVKEAANQSAFLNDSSSAFVAGLFSGFATACISTPTDWFKIQAQISLSESRSNGKQTNRYDFASILRRGIIQDGKFRAPFLAGMVPNLAREGVFTMVYLGLYDRITHAVKVNDNQPIGMGSVVLISSFTGACAWICNYPFDTVKTVMQAGASSTDSKRITLRCAIQSIYNSGGWRAFWRGAGSSTFRAMVVTSSRMLAYEKTIQLLR